MPTAVSYTPAPIGSTVTFKISGYASGEAAQMTIGRAVSGSSSYNIIYSGTPLVTYVDPGEGLPIGLSTGTNYFWQFIDSNGAVTVGPVQPSSYLGFEPYWLTALIVKLYQNGINNLTLPNNTQRASVYHDMPLNGFEGLPAVTITHDVMRQESIGIGQDTINPIMVQNGIWTVPCLVTNIWKFSVFAKDVQTREFYKSAVIAIFESCLQSIFLPLGQNTSHEFIANDYQWIDELKGVSPGLYCSDISVKMDGLFNVGIQTAYPEVKSILIGPTVTGYINSQYVTAGISGLATGV